MVPCYCRVMVVCGWFPCVGAFGFVVCFLWFIGVSLFFRHGMIGVVSHDWEDCVDGWFGCRV